MTFGIWCEVSGGVTGHRSAWLKQDGRHRLFSDRKAAAAVATVLNASANSRHARAAFRYTVRQFTFQEFARK
jgi:hypothetical protein